MLHKPDYNNIREAMAATRYERAEAEYAKIKSSYNPPSRFSAGYAKAIDYIEMQTYTMPYQGYKYANVVVDEETGDVLEYRDLLKHEKYKDTWTIAGANEYGRLFQGVGKQEDGTQRVKGTDACHWISKSQVPKHKKVTYARYVVDIRPEKEDPNRVCITAGGD